MAFLLFGGKKAKRAAADSKSSAARAAARPADREELPSITSEITVAPPPKGSGMPALRITRLRSHEIEPPLAAATSDRAAASPSPSRSAGDEPTREAPAAAKTYVREFTVPGGGKIELGGIVFSETNPVALINGKVASPGSTVEGFTVVQIQADRVELRGNDRTIFLMVK